MAHGICVKRGSKEWLLVPGVPREMEAMIEKSIIPHLQAKYPEVKPKAFYDVHVMMRNENEVETYLANHKFGIYPGYGRVTVRFDEEASASHLQQVLESYIYQSEDGTLEQALSHVMEGKSVAVAESCTGGTIASKLTRIPGASRYFAGGCVTYTNQMKVDLLGVSEKTLSEHGAVSKETVIEMARGMAKLAKSDYALAVSGIAGPDGGTKEKPVGTVYGAIYANGEVEAGRIPMCQTTVREIVIEKSANFMLALLYRKVVYQKGGWNE